jgi:hypothetical protein
MFVGILEILLELAFIINTIWALWLLVNELTRPPRRWRAAGIIFVLAVPFVAFLLWATSYSLAFKYASVLTCILLVLAYLTAVVLIWFGRREVWYKNRMAAIVGMAVPLIMVISSPIVLLIAALMFLGTESSSWVYSGRISPTVSYHVDENLGIWGGAAPTYTYKIYRNPRLFPLLEKEMQEGPVPCNNASPILIQPGRNEHFFVIRCSYNDETPPAQELPLQ